MLLFHPIPQGGTEVTKGSKRVTILGGSYEEQSKNLNAQKSVNWYPVGTLDGKANVALYPTPGWTTLLDAGTNRTQYIARPLIYSPVLDKFVTVADIELSGPTYIKGFKTIIPDDTNWGNVTYYSNFVGSLNPGGTIMSGLGEEVSYLCSDVVGTESMILGVIGSTNANVNMIYGLDISNTSSIQANVVYYEDPIIPTSIAYMKGYVIINHDNPGSTNNDPYRGRFYSNSLSSDQLANGDVVIYDFDYSKMAYNAGEYVKAVKTNGQYLYVFGETHYEVWYFSGETAFPWDVIQEATGRFGIYNKHSIASYQDKLFVVGKSENGSWGVYVIAGLENKKISTPVIDRLLQQTSVAAGASQPTVMVYEFNGNVFVKVVKTVGTSVRGFVYNLTTGMWHEESTETAFGNITQPDSFSFSDYTTTRTSNTAYGLIGRRYLVKMEPDNPTADGAILTRYRVTQHISGEDYHVFHHRLRLDTEANSNISFDSNVSANIFLLSSDDDGKTWYQYPVKSMNNAAYGTVSGDKRVEWFRLGRSDDRIYKIFTNANTQVYLAGGFLDVERGTR